ncbi:hypothetical protein BH581_02990 [Vibrio splendidus]|uniref:hypothetical protein n=1 Tax=Vibrio splendidus TaxID=29497 RepID=UPI000975422B|nr:hypothetical protein [Vibrio splendidus]OMO22823.1 hypothetical protein BH581_02990 [Vibrio splendidus]
MESSAKQGFRFARFMRLLPVGEDKVLVVLKGHLLIEELLSDILTLHLSLDNPLGIKITNNMMFAKKLELCWALSKSTELPDEFWVAIKKLNTIRNKYSHNISPSGIDVTIQDFTCEVERFDPFGYIKDVGDSKFELSISCLYIMLNEQLGALRNS